MFDPLCARMIILVEKHISSLSVGKAQYRQGHVCLYAWHVCVLIKINLFEFEFSKTNDIERGKGGCWKLLVKLLMDILLFFWNHVGCCIFISMMH